MSSVSSTLSSLMSSYSADPYTASASLNDDGTINPSSNSVTGDRTSGLFDTKKKEMGKNDFLMLLVKQMQFQDPLSPTDNTQYLSQLAQFSALESNTNIQTAIDALNTTMKTSIDAQNYSAQSMSNASTVSLIGKEVQLVETDVTWSGGSSETVPIKIHLGNTASAQVEILDADLKVVKTFTTGAKDATNASEIIWDGTNDKGMIAKPGKYAIHIVGSETNGELYAFVKDVVSGVRFAKDGAVVQVAGKEISIGNILNVTQPSMTSEGVSLSPTSAIALLGKTVRIKETTITMNGNPNEKQELVINCGQQQNVLVDIVDRTGKTIATLKAQPNEDGDMSIIVPGDVVPQGTYSIHVHGENTNPSLYAYYDGTVDGISNAGGSTSVRVGGKTVSLSDIVDISTPPIEQGSAA